MQILFMTNSQKKIIMIFVLISLILVAYWQVQNFEFVNYDDDIYVTDNDQIQEDPTYKGIIEMFTDVHTGHWHPITMLSHMLDWQIFGEKAGGHHWSSLIIHILNTVLLFLLLNRMTGSLWRSAVVAALFAVHPINVESVAWVAERKNVLSTFFWFLTMLFYVWYVEKPGWKRYLPVVICFALGLMSKPMLVTLPFVLLLMDYWPLNRTSIDTVGETEEGEASVRAKKPGWRFLVLEKVPLFVLTGISVFMTVYAAKSVGTIAYSGVVSFSQRASNAIVSYALYVQKMFWPMDLAVLYPFVQTPVWQVIASNFFILFITIPVVKYMRKYPFVAVGWFWYLGTLIPVIGIVQAGVQSMADRYAYVSLIGIFIIIVWGGGILIRRYLKVFLIILVALIVTLTMITYRQTQVWENSETLYRQALEVVKPSYILHKNLGLYLLKKNKPEEAAEHLRKAMELRKNDSTLHNSLGVALLMMNHLNEAEKEFKTALRFNPDHARAHNNLGMVLSGEGRVDEALAHFREAIRLEPAMANAHYQLALIMKRKGMDKEAGFHYRKSVQINPEFKNKKNIP